MFRLTFLLLAVIGIAMLVVGNEPAETQHAAAAQRPVDAALLAAPKTVEVAEFSRPASVDALLGVAPRPAAPAPAPEVTLAAAPLAEAEAAVVESSSAPPRRREFLSVNDEVAARRTAQADRAAAAAAAASEAETVRAEVDAALADATVAMVTGTKVNVRSGPSTDYAVVGQVVFGDAAEVLSQNEGGWVRIRIQGDGVEGYIAARFLDGSGLNN